MSENALKKLGIGTLAQDPSAGVLVKINPSNFQVIKEKLQPFLKSLGDEGIWSTGGAGSWDPSYPYQTTKSESGDVDVWLDAYLIRQHLNLGDVSESEVRKVIAKILSNHYPVTQSGITVHIGFPVGTDVEIPTSKEILPGYFQVDLMIADSGHKIATHHIHDYSIRNSIYKGVDQQLALASLANTIPGHPEKTFQYSGMTGSLKKRETGEIVAVDVNEIAKILLHEHATSKNISSVENIIDSLPDGLKNPRLTQFVNDMIRKGTLASSINTL